jgi:hypothetical protein
MTITRSLRGVLVAAAATAAAAVAVPTAPALADGHTLELSASAPPVVGRSMIIKATGTMPQSAVQWPYWFSLDAIPVSVTTTCPKDRWEGYQFAKANGGSVLVFTQREVPDASGAFEVPVAVTPTSPGQILLCGYTDDGATNTLASAGLLLEIQPASSAGSGGGSGGGSGAATTAAVAGKARGGARTCRALLPHPGGCIKDVVRAADRACSKLPSRRGRTQCKRAVRRAVRRGA